MIKESAKIVQNLEKYDEIKFGAEVPSQHENYNGMNQITLHCEKNVKGIVTDLILLLFFANVNFCHVDRISSGKLSPIPSVLKMA